MESVLALAAFHGKSVDEIVKALQQRLKVLRFSSGRISSISVDFIDLISDIIVTKTLRFERVLPYTKSMIEQVNERMD